MGNLQDQLLGNLDFTASDWQQLKQVGEGKAKPDPQLRSRLLALEQQDLDRCLALLPDGALSARVADSIEQRLSLLQGCYADVSTWANQKDITNPLPLLWQLWLPLAQQLSDQQRRLGRPLIQGLLGMQGAGKSTLGEILTLLLAQMGQRMLSVSIDDLYKTYEERQRLLEDDPRLTWRGPPGTHDVDLGIAVLTQLQQGQATEVPQFDKALHGGQGDRAGSKTVDGVDIVMFEGWFLGVQPIAPERFEAQAQAMQPLPKPIVTDGDRAFARDCNARLGAYLPLWARCDRLMVISLTDYRLSKQWRIEAEQRLRSQGRGGMTDAEVGAFVDYYWKALHPELFVQPLIQPGMVDGSTADLVVEIGEGHRVARVYGP